jgi:hypothetical protein
MPITPKIDFTTEIRKSGRCWTDSLKTLEENKF